MLAWQHISQEVTVWGFKKCYISDAADGTGDDTLWEGSEEAGNVKSECEEREGTECGDGDSDTYW